VEVRVNSFNANQAPISTSGAVSFRSRTGVNFSSSPILTNLSIASTATALEIGHPGTGSGHNNSNIVVGNSYSINGPVSVYGQDITISADITVTSASARATFKANGFVQTATGVDLRTAGGDLVLWSDADANGIGNITLQSTNTMCSGWNSVAGTCTLTGGGDIVMGGGAADANDAGLPGGNAMGSGTTGATSTGLALGPCVFNNTSSVSNVISTRGGNLVLRGSSTTGDTSTAAIQAGVALCNGTTINLEAGKLDVTSQFRAVTANYHSSFWVAPWISPSNPNAVVVNSSNSTSDAVTVRAWGSNNDYTSFGLTINNSAGGGALFQMDTIWSNAAAFFNFNSAGPLRVAPYSTSFPVPMNIGSNFALSSSASLFEVGSASNSGQIYISGDKVLSGDITLRGGNVSISSAVTSTGSGKRISIVSDTISLSANISATNSSRLEIAPRTSGRNIVLGVASTSALAIPAAANTFLNATTLQFGSSTAGNISVEASTTFASAKVTNLKLVTPGNVTAVSGAVLTAANLAIEAGGNVNLPGSNSVAGNIAISASASVTYSSAVSYSPAVVDGTNAVFGVGRAISLTNSPSVEQANEFLAVTFNPPPQVLVRDAYNILLDGNNRLAYQYTASATVTTGSGTVTGLTSSSRVGGNITYNAIKVLSGTGTYSFALNVQVDANTTLTVSSANYNVMAGEPGRLIVTATDTTSVVGQAGFSFTVAVEDTFGNRITIGDNKNITVSATVSGTTAAITAGRQVRADDSGLATFSDLVITGSVSDTISVSFTVTYTRLSDNQVTTVSSSVSAITLTHGAAASIALTNSATARSGIALTSQPVVRILDAFGNLVTTGAQSTQTVRILATGATLSGTAAISASAGIATFSNIALEGLAGSKTLSVEVYSPATFSASTTVALTFGNVSQLSLERAAAGAANRIAFTTQPQVALRDSAGNIVTGTTATISFSVSPSATISNGTVAVNTSTGIATFVGSSLQGTVRSYTLSYSVTGASASSIATVSQAISLTHGTATYMAFVSEPTSASVAVTISQPVVVKMTDIDGNLVTTGNFSSGSAILSIGAGTSVSLTGDTSASFSQGIATFSNIAIVGLSGQNVRLRVDSVEYLNHFPTTALFPLNSGAAVRIDVLASANNAPFAPSTVSAGTAQTLRPRVVFRDSSNNTTSAGVAGTMTLSVVATPDTSVVKKVERTYSYVAGNSILTFGAEGFIMTEAGSYRVKISTANTPDVISAPFTVTNASASKLVVVTDMPSTIQSGLTFSPSVRLQVQDTYSNPVLDSVTTISATAVTSNVLSLAGATASNTLGSSFIDVPNLAVTAKAGTAQLRFTATNAGAPINATSITTSQFAVVAGGAYALSVSPTTMTVANRATLSDIAVTVVDTAGNPIPDSAAQIIAAASGVTLSGTAIRFASSGVATYSGLVLSGGAGTYNIGFSSTGLLASTVSVTVAHGEASYVTITTSANAKNAQALASQPVVKIYDVDGNLVTTGAQSTQTVELVVSPGTLTGVTAISASGGIATFSGVAIEGSTGSKTITARIYSPSTLAANQVVELGVGVATKLILETSGAGAASGYALTTQPVLTLRDSSNNLVTGVAHNVVASINPAASLSGTTVAINTASGTATFTALSISGVVGNYSISFAIEGASSSAVASVSQAIDLNHGDAVALRVVSQPSSAVAGVTMSPVVVEVIDARGNRVTTGAYSNATINNWGSYMNASVIVGTKSLSLSAGVATFDNLAATTGAHNNIRLGFSVSGINYNLTSAFIALTPNVGTQLALDSSAAANRVAGVAQASDYLLRLLDAYGNTTNATNTVSVVVAAVSASDGVTVRRTVGTFNIVSGSSFVIIPKNNFFVQQVGDYRFSFSSSGLVTAYTSQFTITNAAADKLVYLQNVPASIQSGLSFSPAIRVQVQDAYNNPVVNATVSISVTSQSGAISSITGGVVENTLGDSFIEFPNLAISGLNGSAQLKLVASAPGTNLNARTYTTNIFQITSGDPYQLSVSATAISAANRTALSTFSVKVLDRTGNLVSNSAAQVSVTLTGATLSGTSIVFASGGISTFSSLAVSGTVGSYDLSVTSTGLVGATVSITITHGAARSIDFSSPATSRNALTASSIVAKILDSDGNLVTSGSQSTQNITLSVSDAVLSGTTNLAATAGIATFSNVAITGLVGSKNLSAAIASPFAISTSNQITLQFGNAHSLDLTTQGQGFENSEFFTTAPAVTVRDVSGNAVSASGMVIRVSVASATLSGSVTASADTSLASFASNLKLRGVAGNYTLVFTAEGTSSSGVISTSQQIALTHGLPSQLEIASHPTATRVGLSFTPQPQLRILDDSGNLVSNSSLVVSVTANGAELAGGNTASAVSGVAEYSGLKLVGSASSVVTLSYRIVSNGTTISATTSVQLLAGTAVATSLSWTVTDVQTRIAPSYSPVIELFDEFGNKVISDNSSTAVAKLYRNGTLVTQSALTFTAVAGEITFANLALRAEPRAGYYYQFEVVGQSAVTTSEFVILPGPVAKLEINREPSAGSAPNLTRTGEALAVQPIIRLLDQDDNLVTTETGTTLSAVIASGVGGSLLTSSASVVNGIATFNQLALVGVVETPTQSAEIYSLKFNYGAISSSPSAQLSVMHNVADRISIVRDAADGRSGLIFDTTPQVVLLDRYGNRVFKDPAVTIIGNPQVQSGSGSAANVNNNQGVRNTAGVYTFQMGISGLVGNTYEINFYKQGGGVTAATQTGITITHGIANKIGFLRLPSSTDSNQVRSKTGESLKVQPVIEVQDAAGNRVLDSADVITATLNITPRGNRDFLKNYTVSATAGVATFSNLAMVVDPNQIYRLNFSYGSNQHTAEVDLQVTHADAEYLGISTSPVAGNKTGDPLVQSPTIVVYDFDGNRTTSLSGVTISASVVVGSGYIESNGLASVTGGIATFQNLTLVAPPGENQQLRFTLLGAVNSASAAVLSPNSQNLSFTFADPTKLRVSQQPSSLAVAAELLGTQPMVRVEDRYGNLVTNYVGSIDVTVAGSGGRLVDGSDNTIGSVSALVVNGVATYNSLRIEGSPSTTYNLQFASAGLTGTSSHNVSISPTAPASIVMQTQPVGGVTAEALSVQPVAKLLDRFGNLVTTDNSTQVTVALVAGPNRPGGASAVVGGTTTVTVVGGVATFTNLTFTGATNRNYVLGFTAGSFNVNANAIQVSPAAAAYLQWITEPIAQRTGEVMGTQPVLRLMDFDGNIAASTSATIVASVSIGGGYIEAGTSSQAVNGIVSFSGLTLVATPSVSQQLTFTATTASGSFAITTSTNLVVSHTTASYLVPQSPYLQGGRQGAVLPTQPKLFLYDRFGNKAIYDSATVVTATIGSGIGGAVSGSNTATAVNGEVQFSGLAATGSPGVNYTLNFAASGGFSLADTTSFTVFKTAEINLSYSPVVYSASKTVSAAIIYTDSTEHSVSFSVTTPSICSVNSSSGVVTVLGAGNCVVRASIADGTYYKSNTKDITLVIAKAPQATLTITNNDYVDFGQVLPLTAVGGSGTATTRFFASGDCRTIGTSLAFQGNATEDLVPTCSIFAYRAGDANHLSVTSEIMDVTVLRIAQQALAIGNSRATAVGDIELFTVGGSGTGTVSYTVTDVGTAQCSVAGSVLSAARNGVCEVSAQKAQDVNYNLATSPAVTFTFSKQIQQVSFTSALPLMPLAGQTYQATATASSGLSISFTISLGQEIQASANSSYSPAVCSLSSSVSGQVLFLRSGFCEITATQGGNNTYASNFAKQRFEIGRQNQTINFEMLTDKTYGSPSWRLGAQASSGLDVSYTVSAGITACSVTPNGILTLLAEGKCQIVASQAGNGSWAPAPDVARLFFVEPDLAGAPAVVSAAVGNQWFTLGYTAPSYLGGSAVQRYRLEVTDVNNNKYVNSACTTTAPLICTISGIPNGVAYTARIAAITNAGIGQYSPVTVPLTPSRAEMSVTQLSANVSSGGLDMTWETPIAIEGNFQRYEVYVWVTGGEQPTTPTTTVTNSSSSTISVAINQIASAAPTVAPAVFVQPQLNVVSSYYRTTSRVFVFGTAQHRPMGFVSLASNQQLASTTSARVGYTMKVVTITDTYSSSQTINTANGVKIGLSAPAAPTQLTLDTQDPAKLIVSWGAPTSDGGFAIEDYDVQVNGQTICANIQARMCEVGTLSPAVTYNVSVKARNALGLGEAAVASHTTPAPPVVYVAVNPPPAPVSPTVSPSVSPTVSPTPKPTTSPTPKPTPTVKPTPSVKPTPTVKPTPSATPKPTATPTPSPTSTTEPVVPVVPGDGGSSGGPTAPGGSDGTPTGPGQATGPQTSSEPVIEPGPVANPAIGATGDDTVLQEFSPLGSPESIAAIVELAMKSIVIAAAAAAAVGAAAAAAAGGASAAGSSSSSSSSSSSAGSSKPESEENDEDLAELEVAQDQIELVEENWGDKLAWFKSRWLTFLDKITHDLALLIAPVSPLVAKIINDGAYLRAVLGSTTLLLPIAGTGLALVAVFQNAGEVFAPTWYLMLAIALLGLFDAFAGFAATLVFLVGTVIAAGNLPDISQVRTLMGVMIIAIGPAMLATAFRTLRKSPARDLDSWWERIADLAIAPFMAGWSVMTMVSVMPAISGLTLNMANHVTDFGIAIAIAAAVRVLLEEGAARYFPARLNQINPTELPDSPLIQKAIALLIRYGIWVVLSGAIVGFGWQAFVGSALFLLPTIVGWYQDRFPNVPWIWRILPTGVPGLAFTILVSSGSAAALAIWLGATPAYAEISFVLLPLPLLLLSLLSMFGREGATEDEVRIAQRNRWVYRIGGVVMLLITLKLTGII
jgi:hypothetical protein